MYDIPKYKTYVTIVFVFTRLKLPHVIILRSDNQPSVIVGIFHVAGRC